MTTPTDCAFLPSFLPSLSSPQSSGVGDPAPDGLGEGGDRRPVPFASTMPTPQPPFVPSGAGRGAGAAGPAVLDSSYKELPPPLKYGPVVLDTCNLFHGIGCDLLRLKGILKHGILSAETAASIGVSIVRDSPGGFNQATHISLSMSPATDLPYGMRSFDCYSMRGLSFVCRGVEAYKLRGDRRFSSGFVDEVYAPGMITPDKFIGLLVKTEILNVLLKDITFDITAPCGLFLCLKINQYIDDLCKETAYVGDFKAIHDLLKEYEDLESSGLSFVQKMVSEKAIKTRLELEITQHTAAAFAQKLEMKSAEVTFRDVINFYVAGTLPLYNSKGFPL